MTKGNFGNSGYNPDAPLTDAFHAVGSSAMGVVIDAGSVIGLATVVLVVMIAQTPPPLISF